MFFKVMPLLVSVLFLFIQPVLLIEKHHFPVTILIPDFPNGSDMASHYKERDKKYIVSVSYFSI